MPIIPLINPEETRVQFESTTPRPRLTVGILTLNEEKPPEMQAEVESSVASVQHEEASDAQKCVLSLQSSNWITTAA